MTPYQKDILTDTLSIITIVALIALVWWLCWVVTP